MLLIFIVDGEVHNQDYQIKKDKKRDAYLSSIGVTVLRFTNEQMIHNMEEVLKEISEHCFPSPTSSPSGRGIQGEGAEHRIGKGEGEHHRVRGSDTVLFIDARKIYTQIDRAHREWTPEQIEFISNIVRLYRGENIETMHGSEKLTKETFPENKYQDVAGLCKLATLKEIEEQGWSLNPGRYVGVVEEEGDGIDFKERLEELNEELETLNKEAKELEEQISENIAKILESKK